MSADNTQQKAKLSRSRSNLLFRRFLRSRSGMIGLFMALCVVLAAVLAELIAPHSYTRMVAEPLLNSNTEYFFGTDQFGRDYFSRIIYGARVSLIVAIFSQVVTVAIGVPVGAISGFLGGKTDNIIMRIVDVFLAFPFYLLAIILVAVLGPSLQNVVIALGVVMWPAMARLVRGQALSIRQEDYVSAALIVGESKAPIIIRHVIPNCMAVVIIQVSLNMASAILGEAGLSFLGLGVQPPTPSWGQMLGLGKDYLRIAPHLCLFPGVFIMIVVLGFNLLGDGLRDTLDPRLKR
jgi:peptide/nickel transport system permease protein